jgi:hypothetical protein
VRLFLAAVPNETGLGYDATLFVLGRHQPATEACQPFRILRGADMQTILSVLTLFYREYFRTKLAEMGALPPIPR